MSVTNPITGREKLFIEGNGVYDPITGRRKGTIILDGGGSGGGTSVVAIDFCTVIAVDEDNGSVTVSTASGEIHTLKFKEV
jgi:hypothetical protein